MNNEAQFRTYLRTDAAVFRKTAESFGGLSNMAPGYPIRINGVLYHTSEALYQACRFPHRPEVQKLIVGQHSPMTAKMKSKPYRNDSRPDWDQVRVRVMRWCLQVKLAQNWNKFSQLLLSTGDRPIVEDSRKDDYWGAKEKDGNSLVGMNVLGRLLMELREFIKQGKELRLVEPPNISNFLLFGEPIPVVDCRVDRFESPRTVPESFPPPRDSKESSLPLFEYVASPPSDYSSGKDLKASSKRKQPMIAGLKPYWEYKESGLPWALALPVGWQIERAKRLFTKMDRPVRPEDEVVTCFRDGMVTLRKNRRLRGFTEATVESGYQGIRRGDLVIHGMDAFAGAIGVSDSDGKGTPVYNVCQPRSGVNAHYYAYTVREMSQSQWILALAKGIRERSTDFRFEMFGNQFVPLPPPDEQAAIVHFLDHANRKIDRFIRVKRKMIALLNEQKQAIIHRAVTRGLDPAAKLKPSSVLWVGGVPEHWTMTPNRSLFRIRKVLVGSRHEEYQVLSLTKQGVIVRDMDAGGKFSNHWERSQEVRLGDIVFCFFDVDETPRAIGLSPAFGMISPDYTVMECQNPLIASFLECFYMAMDDRKMLRPLYTGLRKRISKPLFLAAKTPIPPTEELRTILAFVKDAVIEIDRSLDTITREIALMQEYRIRLTADVVTGKLDVREAAAKLPVLEENLEPIESKNEEGEFVDDFDITEEGIE